MKKAPRKYEYHFIQNGGLIQAQINTIDDVLNLRDLDPKRWTALACPVSGLEFNEETLVLLDKDSNGRVRINEVLDAVDYIKKYFAKPEIIMTEGSSIPLEALGTETFANGKTPFDSAKEILAIVEKADAAEITIEDLEKAKDILASKSTTQDNLIKNESINNKDAADAFLAIKDKLNEYFLNCSLIKYDENAKNILKEQNDALYAAGELAKLPIQVCEAGKPLDFTASVNPMWKNEGLNFYKYVVAPLYGKVPELTEKQWHEIEADFESLDSWEKVTPDDTMLQSCAELRKMILLRQNFVELLRNFVSFQKFYTCNGKAIFQAGTLFIDGKACDLCFKVLDAAKHGTMAALSQCYLLYCDCVKHNDTNEKMQIAALVSNGNTDNLIVGRNGVFYDRKGTEWDATITKIIDNPVSLKQAFWSPYKKLIRFVQDKINKATSKAESSVFDKMTKTVDNPKESAKALPSKKFDIGTIAAISVAFTGVAAVVGQILNSFFGLGKYIPLGIIGIILAISLPSMIIAWTKLRKRNIAPILDASGWAINGNAKISTIFGSTLTALPKHPSKAYMNAKDPFAEKKFPWRRVIFAVILIAIIVIALVWIIKTPGGINGVWEQIKGLGQKFVPSAN